MRDYICESRDVPLENPLPYMIDIGFSKEKAPEALKNAKDNRELEINLYWRRAAYFWVFISLIWTLFGKIVLDMKIMDIEQPMEELQTAVLYFVSCVGLFLSYAWFLVNKGSKYWQENWEYQIDYLENSIMGPSYKLHMFSIDEVNKKTLKSTNSEKELRKMITSKTNPPSVSKINLTVSLFNMTLWGIINFWTFIWFLLVSIKKPLMLNFPLAVYIGFALSLIVTVYFMCRLCSRSCKSSLYGHRIVYHIRSINEPIPEDYVEKNY